MARGSNQSTDTKYATSIVCDAVVLLESGRIESARKMLINALCLLPKIYDETQDKAEAERRKESRGLHA